MRCFPASVRDVMDEVCALKVVMNWWLLVVDGCLDVNEETEAKLCCEESELLLDSGEISWSFDHGR